MCRVLKYLDFKFCTDLIYCTDPVYLSTSGESLLSVIWYILPPHYLTHGFNDDRWARYLKMCE